MGVGERGRKDDGREGGGKEGREGRGKEGRDRAFMEPKQQGLHGCGGHTQWTHSTVGSVPGHVPRGKDSKALEK